MSNETGNDVGENHDHDGLWVVHIHGDDIDFLVEIPMWISTMPGTRGFFTAGSSTDDEGGDAA